MPDSNITNPSEEPENETGREGIPLKPRLSLRKGSAGKEPAEKDSPPAAPSEENENQSRATLPSEAEEAPQRSEGEGPEKSAPAPGLSLPKAVSGAKEAAEEKEAINPGAFDLKPQPAKPDAKPGLSLKPRETPAGPPEKAEGGEKGAGKAAAPTGPKQPPRKRLVLPQRVTRTPITIRGLSKEPFKKVEAESPAKEAEPKKPKPTLPPVKVVKPTVKPTLSPPPPPSSPPKETVKKPPPPPVKQPPPVKPKSPPPPSSPPPPPKKAAAPPASGEKGKKPPSRLLKLIVVAFIVMGIFTAAGVFLLKKLNKEKDAPPPIAETAKENPVSKIRVEPEESAPPPAKTDTIAQIKAVGSNAAGAVEAATEAGIPSPPQRDEVVAAYIESMGINAVKDRGPASVVMINQTLFHINDIINEELKIQFIGIDSQTSEILFQDAGGFLYRRIY